ncbi:MAG: acetyl-CoA carboxylase biotin carboxyl carrier protein [Alphaproteobacteria bacterium]|nr:acetyl-CoA carboxylase biotin carboxyl carrier protein [Alphaproteobacteria bacterium]
MSDNLDTKVISKLAEILDKNNLTELEYEGETFRICLTRDFSGNVQAPTYVQAPMQVQAPVVASAPVVTSAPAVAQEDDYSKHPGAVKSPMVGVVYLSSSPNTPNYVEAGTSVKEGDTICLIEAMKTFNPVKATKSGKVTKILVAGGDPVEYGEPLVIIE